MSLYSSGAVSVADYRVHTGDQDSPASAVTAALVEGQSLLEEHLRRLLESTSRTNDFPIHADGRVYPNAYPITSASLTIDGRALLGAEADSGPFTGVFESTTPKRATVTWTGGFTPTTLPVTLEHAIYELAEAKVTGAEPVPVGATSVRLGDAAVTFDGPTSGGIDALVPGLADRVAKYRNRWAA